MTYRCVAASVSGFVQQLAVGYVAHGYYFYVCGTIPEPKEPVRTDQKIIAQYGIGVSKWTRARRKKGGMANVQYLRYGQFFVIIAKHGDQSFFAAEARRLRDVRRAPIPFMGYSVGCRRSRHEGSYHVSVRIRRETYRDLKARFEKQALHRSVEELCRELRGIPYEPYAPVRDQLRGIVRAINRRRAKGGCEPVPMSVLRRTRMPVKPFAQGQG